MNQEILNPKYKIGEDVIYNTGHIDHLITRLGKIISAELNDNNEWIYYTTAGDAFEEKNAIRTI